MYLTLHQNKFYDNPAYEHPKTGRFQTHFPAETPVFLIEIAQAAQTLIQGRLRSLARFETGRGSGKVGGKQGVRPPLDVGGEATGGGRGGGSAEGRDVKGPRARIPQQQGDLMFSVPVFFCL